MHTHNHLTQAICMGLFATLAAAVPLKADDGDKPYNKIVLGISILNPTGNSRNIVDGSGYGISLAAESAYSRLKAEYTELRPLTCPTLTLEGIHRFGSHETGFNVFGGLVGMMGFLDGEKAYGVGISAGCGYNFNKNIGIETFYTAANKITGSIGIEWIQMSLKIRFSGNLLE